MEIIVQLDQLKPSPSNVRPKHTKEDIAMMANSITHRGLINPPCVAKNGDGKYEIIAGQLRVAGAKAAKLEEIRCLDVSNFTDVERIELSLSENMDRRNMTALEYFVAFNKLFKAGMPTANIGERFGKTEREVQQYLAIGSLPKKLLDLAKRGDISDQALEALAIAPRNKVAEYCKLPANKRPNNWEVKQWLAGDNGMYLQTNAIFDLEEYKGPKIVDLFADDDEVWLTDGAEFLDLQEAAIAKKIEQYTKKGWKVEKLDYWQAWAYTKTAKANGGQVLYTQDERTQEVRFYVGYTRNKTAGATPKTAKSKDKPAEKPEISKAFQDYMAELRHSLVQHVLVANPKKNGLAGTFILLLKQCDNIGFRQGGRNLDKAYRESVSLNAHSLAVVSEYQDMLKTLGIKNEYDIDIKKIAAKVAKQSPATLIKWIVLTVTANWTCDSSNSDELATALDLSEVIVWEGDDAFWNGIKNKATLIAIAKENEIAIDSNATTKVIRAIVREKVPSSWRPKWLKFS